MNRYEMIERDGLNTKDKKYLLRYLAGEKLTPMQTIYAKCYECMGFYIDGKEDCGVEDCPNYPHMPYNPDRTIVKKKMSDEQRVKASERFKKTVLHRTKEI